MLGMGNSWLVVLKMVLAKAGMVSRNVLKMQLYSVYNKDHT